MTTITRLLTVTYGSRTITGPSDLIRFHDGWETGEFTFRFVVRAANMGALATACDAVIQDFRIPHQRLQVKFNGTAEIDWNPSSGSSGNTAFQVIPSIGKHGDPWDSGTAQTFEVTIHCSKPADKDSRVGRRFADVDVSYSQSRRRSLTINGLWTAITSNDATAQYTAQAATFAANVRTALGGTWELVGENYSRDDIDKELRFTLAYHELIYEQAVASVVEQHTFISISKQQSGNSPAPGNARATPLASINVKYDASVDKDVTQDLEDVYANILPWLATKVSESTSSVGLALVNEGKTFDYDENRISLDQTWEAVIGSDLLEYRRAEKVSYTPANVVVPVWSPTRFAKYVFKGPESCTCQVQESLTKPGSRDTQVALDPITPLSIAPASATWVFQSRDESTTETVVGRDFEFLTTTIDRTCLFEACATVPAAAAAQKG